MAGLAWLAAPATVQASCSSGSGTIAGTWSWETVLDPDRLAAGSTTGADIRIVATFTADDGNTVITAVDTCGEEDISATSSQESVTHVGFASAVNATLSHQHFEHFSYPETPTDSDPIQCSSAPGSMTGTLSITSCSTRL